MELSRHINIRLNAAIWLLIFLGGSSLASRTVVAPDDGIPDDRILDRFEESRRANQYWKSSDPLPTKLADIGFSKEYKVIYQAVWCDGGSVGYLLQDCRGILFGLCVCGPSYYDGESTVSVKWPTYFPGIVYPPKKGDRSALDGSDAAKFLSSLIGQAPFDISLISSSKLTSANEDKSTEVAGPHPEVITPIAESAGKTTYVTCDKTVEVRLQDSGGGFLITVLAGKYREYGKDGNGTYYIYEGTGLIFPKNFGAPKRGGIFIPSKLAVPCGLWILPPRAKANMDILFLGRIHEEQKREFDSVIQRR